MKYFFAVVVSCLIIAPSYVLAEYNSFKLGEAAGEYIYATALMNELENSYCGYLSIDKTPLILILEEVKIYLKPADRKEISASNIPLLEVKAKRDVSNIFNELLKKMDHNTACGVLYQNILILNDKGKKKWDFATKNYS